MRNSTIIHEMTPEQIASLFDKLSNQIAEISSNLQPKEPTEYLTRKELATLLKCDVTTIHNWTVKGKIKPYGIGNRVYYKRSEIEEAIQPLT